MQEEMLVLFSIEQFFNCKIGLMQIKKVCMTHNPHPWKYDCHWFMGINYVLDICDF